MKQKVGDKVGRLFSSGKEISREDFTILEITDKTLTIDEFGRKKDGTYGARVYDIDTGYCLDDPFKDYKDPKMYMTRRRINFNLR